MQITEEMYTELFNGITEAREQINDVAEFLNELQFKAEKLFIESDLN